MFTFVHDARRSPHVTPPYAKSRMSHARPSSVSALGNSFLVNESGVATLYLPCADADATCPVEPYEFTGYVQPLIGSKGHHVDILLNCAAGYALGYITEVPSAPSAPMPTLPALVDRSIGAQHATQRMRRDTTTSVRRNPGRLFLDAFMLVTLVATTTGWSWEAPREPPKGPRRPRSWYDEEPPAVDDDAPVGDDDTATNESADGTQVPDVQGGNSPLDGLHCYLAESKVAEVLRTKAFPRKGTVVHSKAELGWGDCGPGRDHTLEQRRQYEALIDSFDDIFLTEAFPKACKAAPIVIPLIDEDAKLPFEKAQSGGMQHQAYLSEVRDQLLSFDILGDPDHPEGASRMTLAAKGPDDIRACMDLRRTNPLLRTFAYHYTSGPEMVERLSASTHRYRSSFDLASAYSQLPVATESQRLLGVTFPDPVTGRPRVYTYKRLPFGLTSSSAHLMQFLEKCFEDLPADMRQEALFYYMDDLALTAATFEELLHNTGLLFAMCRKHGLTLSYQKSQCLVSTVEFFGYRCGPNGVSLTESNLTALRAIQHPKSVSETRHVIGVFGVARRFVDNFAHHMEPLLRLVRKDQQWRWGAAEAAAFAHVRDKLVENISLHKFVPELPLVVHCDASGSAEGAWLAQVLPSGDLQTIAFYSKSFSAAMRKQGATAREAHAVIFALHAARVYTLSSPHPTTVYTDCRSLTFVKDSTRSELSLRFLQKIEDQRFVIRYKKGSENTVADAYSRLPLLGPDLLSPAGTAIALDDLLDHVADSPLRQARTVWVHMTEYVEEAYRVVQLWRKEKNVMSRSAPIQAELARRHDFRILRFDAHQAVEGARNILSSPCPAAILMPLDLSGGIAVGDDGHVIPALSQAVNDCKKIVYLGSNTLWLLHQMGDLDDKVCMTGTTTIEELEALDATELGDPSFPADVLADAELVSDLPDGNLDAHHHYGETRHLLQRLARLIDVTTWPSQQTLEGLSDAQAARIATDEQGLKWVRSDDGPDRLLVPTSQRTLLLELVHTETNHASAAILKREIGRDYWWPGIAASCDEYYQKCDACARGSVRRNIHHNIYASSTYSKPREVVALDFKKITIGGLTSYLLLIVCKFSGFVTVAVLPQRTAACVIQALDEEFFSVFGPPRKVTIDGAPEFKSAALRAWLEGHGVELVQPMEYYPQAAGIAERVWVMIRAALRRTTDFTAWRAQLRQAVYMHNTVPRRESGVSPFLLFFGGEPNTTAASKAAAVRTFDDARLTSDADVRDALLGGNAAHAQAAAANSNHARRARAVDLNKAGRTPHTFFVGDAVWVWQEVSGSSTKHRGRDRPRSCLSPWLPGVIVAINGPRHTIRPPDVTSSLRYMRHPTALKLRFDPEPPPALGTTPTPRSPLPPAAPSAPAVNVALPPLPPTGLPGLPPSGLPMLPPTGRTQAEARVAAHSSKRPRQRR